MKEGDNVVITVMGVAQVKVAAGAAIQPGERLTAADTSGQVRALHTESLNGMMDTEGAAVIGIVLAAPVPRDDTIPVFVSLR